MANHVIRDRLWESKKLQKCSREAALAYPWIFLVADDWGRFEYDPRRIWSLVFGARQDVTTEEVAVWLGEYVRTGLLILYKGGELAYWTGFIGRPPSKRRPSQHLDPKQDKPVPKRKRTGTPPVPNGYLLAERSVAEQEQSRRAEQEPRAGELSGNGNGSASPPAASASGIQHDPTNGLQQQILARCQQLAAKGAAIEKREVTDHDVREVFIAVSGTPRGKTLDSMLKAPVGWLEETLRACDRFEEDLGET